MGVDFECAFVLEDFAVAFRVQLFKSEDICKLGAMHERAWTYVAIAA